MAILFVPAGHIDPVDQLSEQDTLLRCQAALSLWFESRYSLLLVSGGVFNPSETQTVPAAQIMSDWFVARGVPRDRIILEVASRDTFENIEFSYRLLKSLNVSDWQDIVVVTHWTHLVRFRITFKKWYNLTIKGIPLTYPLGWKACLTEVGSFTLHVFSHRGNSFISRWLRRHRQRR